MQSQNYGLNKEIDNRDFQDAGVSLKQWVIHNILSGTDSSKDEYFLKMTKNLFCVHQFLDPSTSLKRMCFQLSSARVIQNIAYGTDARSETAINNWFEETRLSLIYPYAMLYSN